MSAIYNEYLTGAEREEAIAEAALMNEYEKLTTLFEMTMLNLAQMERDAEFKVFAESGTYEDLQYLIQEANEEVQNQQQGIFSKIVQTVVQIFKNMVNKIKSLFGKGDPEEEVEISNDTLQKSEEATGIINKVTSIIDQGFKSNDMKAIGGLILKITLGGAVVAGVTKMKRKDVEAKSNTFTNAVNGLMNKINSITDGKFQPVIDAVNKHIKPFLDGITKGFSSALNKVVEGAKNLVGGNTEKKEAKERAEQHKKDNQQYLKNGIKPKVVKGETYNVDTVTGKITKTDKSGTTTDVDFNNAPREIQKLSNKSKGKAAMAQKARDEAAEKQKKVDANYAQNKSFTSDNSTIKVYGKDGRISRTYKDEKGVTRVETIKEDDLSSVVKNRNLRKKIKEAVNAAKNGIEMANRQAAYNQAEIKESVDFSEIESMGYIVESDGDDIVFIETAESDFNEYVEELRESGYIVEINNDVISVTETVDYEPASTSIFGYDISDELVAQESSDFDEDVNELAELFASL